MNRKALDVRSLDECAPDYRALLHSGVRHPNRLFRPARARGSPGVFAPPGYGPHSDGLAFTGPSLTRFFALGVPSTTPPQGIAQSEVGGPLSRSPTLMGFFTSWRFTHVRLDTDPGVTSSVREVRHRPPPNILGSSAFVCRSRA
jgi:hypothetical protein